MSAIVLWIIAVILIHRGHCSTVSRTDHHRHSAVRRSRVGLPRRLQRVPTRVGVKRFVIAFSKYFDSALLEISNRINREEPDAMTDPDPSPKSDPNPAVFRTTHPPRRRSTRTPRASHGRSTTQHLEDSITDDDALHSRSGGEYEGKAWRINEHTQE